MKIKKLDHVLVDPYGDALENKNGDASTFKEVMMLSILSEYKAKSSRPDKMTPEQRDVAFKIYKKLLDCKENDIILEVKEANEITEAISAAFSTIIYGQCKELLDPKD